MNNLIKGYLFATLALISGGGYYLFSKYTTEKFQELSSTENMAFWGFLGAFVFTTPYFFRSKNSIKKIKTVTQKNYKLITIISFISSIAITLYWYVLTLTEVGTIALLSQSNVLFSLIMSALFLGERINRKEMMILAGVIIGFIFLSTNNPELPLLAFFLILLTRFLYALQSFFVKKFGKDIDGFIFGYVRTFLIMIFLGIITMTLGKIEFISLEFFGYVTLTILFGAILLKSFYFEAHKYLEVGRLNIFMLFQAVITIIGSIIFFQESLGFSKIIGTIFIIGGLVFFTKEQLRVKPKNNI